MDGTWTISELAERAAAALAADGSAQVSGRVRDLPNERLIRWYTTIGLVDPPLGRRGRTALYGPRHLLQLVAVKRRQAAGSSIAEIQLELAAATDATLEQVAAGLARDTFRVPRREAKLATSSPPTELPTTPASTGPTLEANPPDAATTATTTGDTEASIAGAEAPGASSTGSGSAGAEAPGTGADGASIAGAKAPSAASTGTSTDGAGSAEVAGPPDARLGNEPARTAFWSTRPDVSYTSASVADDHGRPDAAAEVRPSVVQGVRLNPGLTLLLDVPTLDGDDLAAIETAARPLLDELRRRGLLTPAASPAFLPADSSRRSQ